MFSTKAAAAATGRQFERENTSLKFVSSDTFRAYWAASATRRFGCIFYVLGEWQEAGRKHLILLATDCKLSLQ